MAQINFSMPKRGENHVGMVKLPILYYENTFGFYSMVDKMFYCDESRNRTAYENVEYVLEIAKAMKLKSLADKQVMCQSVSVKNRLGESVGKTTRHLIRFNARLDDVDKVYTTNIKQAPTKDILGRDIDVDRKQSISMLYCYIKESELKAAFESNGLEYPGKDALVYDAAPKAEYTRGEVDNNEDNIIPSRRRR